MGNRLRLATILCGCLAAKVAVAEDWEYPPAPPDPAPQAQAAPTPPPAPVVEAVPPDAAWTIYNRAFAAVVAGNDDEAAPDFARVLNQYPDHPAAAFAREMLKTIQVRAAGPSLRRVARHPPHRPLKAPVVSDEPASDVPATPAPQPYRTNVSLGPDQPTMFARGELVFGEVFSGFAFGVSFCLAIGCNSTPLFILLPAGFGAAGLTLSLVLTPNGIEPGHMLMLLAGQANGLWTGGMLAGGAGAQVLVIGGALTLGQLLGTGLGEALWLAFRPTEGQVSLAVSGGLWASVLTLLVQLSITPSLDSFVPIEIALMGDLGIVGAAALAAHWKITPGQVLIINAGGVLGGAVGALAGEAAIAISPSLQGSSQVFTLSIAAGVIAGLAGAAALARSWEPPVALTPVPTLLTNYRGGAMPGLALYF